MGATCIVKSHLELFKILFKFRIIDDTFLIWNLVLFTFNIFALFLLFCLLLLLFVLSSLLLFLGFVLNCFVGRSKVRELRLVIVKVVHQILTETTQIVSEWLLIRVLRILKHELVVEVVIIEALEYALLLLCCLLLICLVLTNDRFTFLIEV
jgi:hypothetical protein